MFKISNHLFTEKDKHILRKCICRLPSLNSEIIIERFWLNQTIEEIASNHNLSWHEIDTILMNSLKELKTLCLSDKDFSLAKRPQQNTAEHFMKAA